MLWLVAAVIWLRSMPAEPKFKAPAATRTLRHRERGGKCNTEHPGDPSLLWVGPAQAPTLSRLHGPTIMIRRSWHRKSSHGGSRSHSLACIRSRFRRRLHGRIRVATMTTHLPRLVEWAELPEAISLVAGSSMALAWKSHSPLASALSESIPSGDIRSFNHAAISWHRGTQPMLPTPGPR